MTQNLSQIQVIRSLGQALDWFEKEIEWGVPPGELNHLTGRIGELYAAMVTRGQMALATNQRGYDIVSLMCQARSVHLGHQDLAEPVLATRSARMPMSCASADYSDGLFASRNFSKAASSAVSVHSPVSETLLAYSVTLLAISIPAPSASAGTFVISLAPLLAT